jgi:hypothetical protein
MCVHGDGGDDGAREVDLPRECYKYHDNGQQVLQSDVMTIILRGVSVPGLQLGHGACSEWTEARYWLDSIATLSVPWTQQTEGTREATLRQWTGQ